MNKRHTNIIYEINPLSMKMFVFVIAGVCCLTSCWQGTVKKNIQIGWGGRAISVDVDKNNPNNVWVATPTGGLFHSGNGGADWGQYYELPENNSFDIKISPWDSNTLIASCIEDTKVKNGGGIWVSYDAGHNWTQPATAIPVDANGNRENYSAFGISFQRSIRSQGSYNIYVGTDYGFAVSTDKGLTWRIINPQISGIKNSIYSIVALDTDKVITFGDQGIWISDNNLTSWYQDNNKITYSDIGSTHTLALSPLNSDHLFLTNGNGVNNLFYSVDAGKTWKSVNSDLTSLGAEYGGSRGIYIKAIRSLSGNSNDIDLYYGSGGLVAKQTITLNGGDYKFPPTWTNLGMHHSDNTDMAFSNDGKTLYATNDGGVEKSTDAGNTWQEVGDATNRFDGFQVYDTKIVLSPNNYTENDLYFGTQDNNVYGSNDNGETWPGLALPEGGNIQGPIHKSEGYVITYFLDQGNVRSGPVFSNPPEKYLSIPFMSPSPLSQKPHIYYVRDKLFVGFGNYPTGNNGLYVSSNDGNVTWTNAPVTNLTQPIRNHLKISGPETNPSIIAPFSGYLGSGLVRIDNVFDGIPSNESQTPIALPPGCKLGTYGAQWISYVYSFGVDPKDPDFVIVPDTANNQIYISTDGGTNWTRRDDLTNLITDSGKYYFHMPSMARTNYELSLSQVTNITFDPLNTNRILVGTTESGVIYSPDHGTTWYRIKDSERIPNITSFAFNQVVSGEAVVSSWGRGLWTISLDVSTYSGMGFLSSAYAQGNRNFKIVPGDKNYANKLYNDTLSPVLYFQSKQGSDFDSIIGGTETELIGKRWLKTHDPSHFIFDLDNKKMDWKEFLSVEKDSFAVKMPLFNVPGGHKVTVIENDDRGNSLKSTLYFNVLTSDTH